MACSLPGVKHAEFVMTPFRADMVWLNGKTAKLGEIKPESNLSNPKNHKKGLKQLANYIAEFGRINKIPSGGLTEYKPTPVMSVPYNNWTLHAYTVPSDPGMYYYYFDDGLPEGTPQPSWNEGYQAWWEWRFGDHSSINWNKVFTPQPLPLPIPMPLPIPI